MLPTKEDYYLICRFVNNKGQLVNVIVTYLTDEEEELYEKKYIIELKRGKHVFTISDNNIYCYGDIDLSKDSEDSEALQDLPILNSLKGIGVKLPANYDYETHSCTSDTKYVKYYESWNILDIIKYAKGCLNKPNKLVIFNYVFNRSTKKVYNNSI